MSKKITDIAGNEIKPRLPVIKDVNPVGTCLLVELLTSEELLGPTKIHIPEGTSKAVIDGAPQGYILKIGARVDSNWGFQVGDRVSMTGNFTPIPEAAYASKNGRPLACVEPHVIKAILVEK